MVARHYICIRITPFQSTLIPNSRCWVDPFALVFFRGAEKRLKAAKALKEKGETPEELLRSIKENEAAVAEAQRTVDAWKAIVGEKSHREEAAKAEAERIATEKAEAERKAAEERERAEKEEKARIEAEKKEAERIAAEKAEEEVRVEAERKAEEERKTKEEERKERDENGQPFVVSSDGTTTFGEITEDTGLTAAPIKLSEGVADEKGNGYGLRHIEARHGDQIRKAGFSSVEEFIEQVAKNYDVIYGAQNEAYMSRSAEKRVRGLCFNELGVGG